MFQVVEYEVGNRFAERGCISFATRAEDSKELQKIQRETLSGISAELLLSASDRE